MTGEQHQRAKRAFLELLSLPEGDRPKRLEELCGDDPQLMEEVQGLLEHHVDTVEDVRDPLDDPRLVGRKEPPMGLATGTVVADRYRVVERLGRGGMGEVYRAEDLVVGEQVALKFLRADLPVSKDQVLREVRLARQVTHPNVCRVFDLGESDGQLFLTMEYIDGEDLATLLNRIGRLPKDRTLFLARQLFAGLAAAHARGVLHLDLKPANVMIDGRGQAKLTDFGISALEGEAAEGMAAAGTPAYMAPEQLKDGTTSVRSDLYSLGIVIYELCTGQYPYSGTSFQELAEAHREQVPPPPSGLVDDLEPLLERVILKCLEKRPEDRPDSALAVAAALPGVDPLHLALEVGETPSPDMVAKAGGGGAMEPRGAGLFAGLLGALLLLLMLTAEPARRLQGAGLVHSPQVLAEKAREHLRAFGWTEPAADTAYGFLENPAALTQSPRDGTPKDTSAPGASPVLFWYRQSPYPMMPTGIENLVYYGASIEAYDPPLTEASMALVMLHPSGTLDHLEVYPDLAEDDPGESPRATDFSAVLRAAGLDAETLSDEPAVFAPSFFADSRAAYSGASGARPDLPLAIEIAGYRGRVVHYRMSPEASDEESEGSAGLLDRVLGPLIEEWYDWYDLLSILAVASALPLARRNLRRGRGDLRGASRLAALILGVQAVVWVIGGPHVADLSSEWALALGQVGQSLLEAGLLWVFYLALEPYVRRIWPHTLIAWTRALAGRYRDPLVAKSLFVGTVFGAFWAFVEHLDKILPAWLGLPHAPLAIEALPLNYALDAGRSLASALALIHTSLYDAVFSLLVLMLLRMLLRRPLPAALAYVTIFTVLYSGTGTHPHLSLLTVGLAVAATEAWLLVRFGLLTFAGAVFSFSLLRYFPLSLDASAWYAGSGYFALVVLAAIALYSGSIATRTMASHRRSP
ncbi:MAG: serine/threonine-protein kinase, partial [Acidobacteriota bacterium]